MNKEEIRWNFQITIYRSSHGSPLQDIIAKNISPNKVIGITTEIIKATGYIPHDNCYRWRKTSKGSWVAGFFCKEKHFVMVNIRRRFYIPKDKNRADL